MQKLASRLQILDRLGQTALCTSGRVGVDDVLGGCLIELLGGNLECGGAGFDIAGGDRRTDLADGRANGRTDRAIVQTASLALTKTFLGTGGIWHLGIGIWGLSCGKPWARAGQPQDANHPLLRNSATLSSRSATSR